MKKLSFLLLLTAFLIGCNLDPCGTPENFIEKQSDFVNLVLEEKLDYTDEDWDLKNKELDQMVTECYEKLKPKMTSSQKRTVNKNNAKFAMAQVEKEVESLNLDELGEKLSELFDEDFEGSVNKVVLEVSEEFKDVFDEDFKDKIEEVFDEDFKNSVKDAIDDIGGSLKEVGEALKEAIDKIEVKEE